MPTCAPARYFAQQHYEAHRGLAPAPLCELVVHCLELVARLARYGVPFRFKGGNSLLVMLQDPQRFSIDVDIATAAKKEELTRAVERVVAEAVPFTRWESRQPKTKPWLPLISYKLFFPSCYRAAEDAFVMLDAVLEPAPYPGEKRPVRCGELYRAEQEVEVPTVAGLIGDKLLTIGPSTLGIPLGRGKEAQRLKHVFDVSLLSRLPFVQSELRSSLSECQAQEERMQGRHFAFSEIALDTRRFCGEALVAHEPPPLEQVPEGTYLYEIVKGFDLFREHLFRVAYTWSMFRADCGRVIELLDAIEQSA